MNIVELECRCGTLWFFNLPSAKKLIFSLIFDHLDLFSQMTQKVCYMKRKNSEILSKPRNSELADSKRLSKKNCRPKMMVLSCAIIHPKMILFVSSEWAGPLQRGQSFVAKHEEREAS